MGKIVERVLVQCEENGDFPNAALFAAYLGFKKRGYDVVRKTDFEIEEGEARAEQLVFGGVEVVRPYLARLNAEPPPIDYPECLKWFLRRNFTHTTMGEVRQRYNEPGRIAFLKPVKHKEFNGHFVQRFGDLIHSAHVPSDSMVYLVEYTPFVSEWRFLVHQGKVKGACHYHGSASKFPDIRDVKKAAQQFSSYPRHPIAYGLDVGVGEDGLTRLVEINDMISLGTYGTDPWQYSTLIEHRWDQLVTQR